MTIIYCDLCGRSLEKGDSGVVAQVRIVQVSEYRADSCEDCARKLINYLKPGPWKGGAK